MSGGEWARLRSVSGAVSGLAQRRPRLAEQQWLAELRGRWAHLVGPALAQRCAPVALRGRQLVVRVNSAAWCVSLQTQSRLLLDKLSEQVPGAGITSLHFAVGSLEVAAEEPPSGQPDSDQPAAGEVERTELDPAVSARIEAVSAQLEDADLRAAFARRMIRNYQLQAWQAARAKDQP